MTTLLDAAVHATLLASLALVAVRAMPRASAALRHAVLAASVMAIAVAPLATLVLPAWTPWTNVESAASDRRITAAATPQSPAAVSVVAPDDEATARASPASTLWLTLMGIWLAGIAVTASRLVHALARLRRVRKDAIACADLHLRASVASAADTVGLTRPPTVLLTPHGDLMATWGLVRPSLVLPMQAVAWPHDRLSAVLVHECAHIRRRDWLIHLGAEAVRCVHWYNPVVQLACRSLRFESERACDDVVVDAGTAPARYAEHLVAIARDARPPRVPSAMAMSIAHPPGLERRITAMLNPTLDRRPLTRRAATAVVLATLAVAIPVAAMQSPQAQDDLKGTVYDATGAVVPEVALALEDAAGPTATATTDSQGRFDVPAIRAGEYSLTAQRPGFQKLRQTFTLSARPDWDRAIILQLGTVSESIRVAADRKAAAATTTDAPAAPTPVRVGGNIRAPMKTHDVKPVYPASMRDAGREGTVALEAIIGRDGLVHSLRVLGAHVHPDFAIAAAEAARQWRFTPTLLNGEPVDVVMNVSVEFSLNE